MGANSCIIYNPTTMADIDDREGLMALPLQERAVAVALKSIFDKIREIEAEENTQVQTIHHSFNNRFRELELKVLLSPPRPARSSKAPPLPTNNLKILTSSSPRVNVSSYPRLLQQIRGFQATGLSSC